MPRKYLKRWSPHPDTVRRTRGLGFLANFLKDPNLFHFNRYSVSMGVFVGLFVAWLPIPGQLPLAALMAISLRCNLPISMLLTCLNNPFTFALVLMITYRTGAWMMGDAAPAMDFSLSWEFLRNALPRYWRPLALGSISLGLISGVIGALLARAIWRFHVSDRWRRRCRQRAAARARAARAAAGSSGHYS